MSGFYSIKELECFGKNFLFRDWHELSAFGLSHLMLQQQSAIIQASHLPWHLFSISLMSWWKRSPCSSLTSPQLAGNRSRCLCKKCTLILMLAPRRWYACSMFCTTSSKLAALLLQRKFCTTPTKPRHASASSFSSCISFWMSGPSKIPGLGFSILSPGNDRQMYLKQSPSLSRVFINCLISPNFICRYVEEASIILPLGTRGWCIMFLSTTLSVIQGSQSLLTQWLALSRLSHIHKKHGCFVYPDCCTSRKLTIFRSTQIFQLCWLYFMHTRTCFTGSYFSFSVVEWPTGIGAYSLVLCNNTHFKLL